MLAAAHTTGRRPGRKRYAAAHLERTLQARPEQGSPSLGVPSFLAHSIDTAPPVMGQASEEIWLLGGLTNATGGAGWGWQKPICSVGINSHSSESASASLK